MECSVACFHVLDSATGSPGVKRPADRLVEMEWVCIPALLPHSSLPQQDRGGESDGRLGVPALDQQAMVPSATGALQRNATAAPRRSNLVVSADGKRHPLIRSRGLRLLATRLSGDASRTEVFRRKWSTFSWPGQDRCPDPPTDPLGTIGRLGVAKGV